LFAQKNEKYSVDNSLLIISGKNVDNLLKAIVIMRVG